jgi:hypothetical protein
VFSLYTQQIRIKKQKRKRDYIDYNKEIEKKIKIKREK